MILVVYASNVKPDKLHCNSKIYEVFYFRSKHEDKLKLPKNIQVNLKTVYTTILQTKSISTNGGCIQIANAQF